MDAPRVQSGFEGVLFKFEYNVPSINLLFELPPTSAVLP